MLWNAKNREVSDISYAFFGYGNRVFAILSGLSDGLTTVQGKALLLAKPYSLCFNRFTVYMFSRKMRCPPAIPSGTWLVTKQKPYGCSGLSTLLLWASPRVG